MNHAWGVFYRGLSFQVSTKKGVQERLVEPLVSHVKSYEGGIESDAHIIVC